ncbi:MAG: DUF1285 domain-containing protein [Pseudomonadales bacterium]|nr:DUF1285 domain-containing protein [Pseudomonadales bacterium]
MAIMRLLKDEQGNMPKGLPPVHKWNPDFCGDIPMQIKANGQWFYMGTPIGRPALVKLFSSILRHDEDGCFYLVTPVEKVRIVVDDAPLIATLVDKIEEDGVSYLRFATLTEDVVIADAKHALWVNYDEQGEPRPYIRVRDNLDALIARNVFYQLVEWAEVLELEGQSCYAVQSAGQWFKIAPCEL